MHNTSPNHSHAATLKDNTTLDLNHPSLQNLHTSYLHKMDQSTHNVEYWDMLWLMLLKHNLGDFSTMVKHMYHSALLLKE